VLPDDVFEDLRRALVLVEGAGDGLDRAGRDVVALLDQVGSPTTVSAVRTSVASPSSVRTLPRRKRSTSR
jgi:hypothetical protein